MLAKVRRGGFSILVAVFLSSPAASARPLPLNVQEHTLKNGLRILVVERHDAPVFSVHMAFKVGSVNETPGISGVSHLLEHMLFKGTRTFGTWSYEAEKPIMEEIERLAAELDEKIATKDQKGIAELREKIRKLHAEQRRYMIKDEIWDVYLRSGAVGLNASTGQETTQYYLSLPSNRLELWAILESDRFRSPVFREFYVERDVVFEERRRRTDTQPGGKLSEAFYALAFMAHAYRLPTVGWPSDISRIQVQEVGEYYRSFYAPNNAVVAFVGDVRFPQVVALMEKHFGDLPRSTTASEPKTEEAEQSGERRAAVEFDAEPEIRIGFHTPPLGHANQISLEVLSQILSRGRTGRLYQSLIEKKKIAVNASAADDSGRFSGLFTFAVTPRAPHTVEEAERAVYEEVERLKQEPVSDWELKRVKNALELDALRQIRSNASLARLLAYFETVVGRWRYFLERIEGQQKITAADLMRVAKEHLARRNRTVAWIEKPG
jgi:predicted Zn-dependent peptidase